MLQSYLSPLYLVIQGEIITKGEDMIGCRTLMPERAESLTDALLSLAEPWRSRFLTLVAQQATCWTWNGRLPTRDEVVTWLGDEGLYEGVRLLLNTWQGLREDKSLPIH